MRELSADEIDCVSGGLELGRALAGGVEMFGGGMIGYGAAVAAGIGMAPVAVGAIGAIGAVAVAYGAYEVVTSV